MLEEITENYRSIGGSSPLLGVTRSQVDALQAELGDDYRCYLGMFFSDVAVTGWDTAERADTNRFAAYHRAMLERGVYLAPSQFEAGFLSTVHGDSEIDATLEAARDALAGV